MTLSDRTREIVPALNVRASIETTYKVCGLQKNRAIEKCCGDWILFLDADEVVSEELKEEIKRIIHLPDTADVYKVRFQSYCFGRSIKHGGWSANVYAGIWGMHWFKIKITRVLDQP